MRLTSSVVARRWSYRRGQTALLFLLSLLVVVACAAGPFYERAVEDATVRSALSQSPLVDRGISLDLAYGAPLSKLLPSGSAAKLFQTPVTGVDLPSSTTVGGRKYLARLSSRQDDCAHLHLVAGRCPTAANEVLMSAASARVLKLGVGQSIVLTLPDPNRPVPNKITGLYAPFSADNDYWFGRSYYSSAAGVVYDDSGTHIDSVFGAAAFVAHQATAGQQYVTNGAPNPFVPDQFVDLPLRPSAVGVDQLATLRGTVNRLGGLTQTQGVVAFTSNLPDLLDSIDRGRSQARTIIYALAAQLALLALIAFGVVVAASTDQRRPELALARLRGRGRGRAADVLLREIGGVVLLAAIPGVALAWLFAELACRRWLVAGVHPQWQWPVLAATGGAVVVALVLVRVIAGRASRSPITDLLRQVPVRTGPAGVGLAEAAVGAATLAGLVTIFSGSKDNALSTLAPSLIAVLAGLLVGRAVVALGRILGRRQLARGRVVAGLAGLTIGRRSGYRLAITALCVATALVVFAGQQWSVASTNRHQRALAENGARVVLAVSTPDVATMIKAVHDADPDGKYATPVVIEQPPGVGATRLVAVEPTSFAAVASWGRGSAAPSTSALSAIEPTRLPPPITVTGTTLKLSLADLRVSKLQGSYQTGDPYGATPPPPQVTIGLVLRTNTGQLTHVEFGTFGETTRGATTLTAPAGCLQGCRLVGLELTRPPLDSSPLQVVLDARSLQGNGAAQSMGTSSEWGTTTPVEELISGAGTKALKVSGGAEGAVRFSSLDDGDGTSAQYLNEPIALPILTSGDIPQTRDDLGLLTVTSIDGQTVRVKATGAVDFIPQVGSNAALVDLELAAAQAGGLQGAPSVWLSSDDPSREKTLTAALAKYDVTVVERSTSAQRLSQFTHSSPAWSAQLTIVVAILAALIAAALLVLLLISSRRSRVRDMSAARLAGVGRATMARTLRVELATVVLAGVLLGLVVGVVGVRLSLPSVPIFDRDATVPLPIVYPMVWTWLVGCVVALLVVLVVAAGAAARRVSADVRPDAVFGER